MSQGEIGDDRPISFASRSLNKHEKNRPVIEKELLGIYWGIQFFRPYLYGRKFIVVTDHRPLVALFTHKNPSSKLTRIRLDLSDYDFQIIYKKRYKQCECRRSVKNRVGLWYSKEYDTK